MDPGAAVYRGLEGTGEATIFTGGRDPFALHMAQQRQQAQSEAAKQRLAAQMQKQRDKDISDLWNVNPDQKSYFQRENTIDELNNLRKKTLDYATQDPYASANDIRRVAYQDQADWMRRQARRDEIYETAISPTVQFFEKNNDLYDDSFAKDRLLRYTKQYDQSGRSINRDVEDIDPQKIQELANHPAAYKWQVGLVDSAKGIEDQVLQEDPTGITANKYGLQFDEITKKLRFRVDPKTGQIENGIIENLLESNPKLGDAVRWDIAKEEVVGNKNNIDLTDEEENSVMNRFKTIQYSNDPNILAKEKQKVRSVLDQMQQVENRHRRSFTKFNEGDLERQVSPQDFDIRDQKIRTIQNAFGSLRDKSQASDEAIKAASEFVGGKIGGMNIIKASFAKGKGKVWPPEIQDKITKAIEKYGQDSDEVKELIKDKNKMVMSDESTDRLVLEVKSGTEEGKPVTDIVPIDLTNPGAYQILNNLYNTIDTKKIRYDELFKRSNIKLDLTDSEGYFKKSDSGKIVIK